MNYVDVRSKEYPPMLRELKDAPEKLYFKGNLEALSGLECLSVVGSRKMTSYGKKVTRDFVVVLAGRGLSIVSGFMYGVDAEAHKAALSVGGKTVAVLAGGVELVTPTFQNALYNEILENDGLVVSEYPGLTPPKRWTFCRRNRIVAAASKALLVVEAGSKSGTLGTADYARKLNRRIFVVPGNVFYPSTKGIYQLVDRGAKVAHSSSTISEYYFSDSEHVWSSDQKHLFDKDIDPGVRRVLDLLRESPLTMDQVIRNSSLKTSEAITAMTSLSMMGLVTEEGSTYYACKN
jgi:DNA processing protein